MKYLVIPANDQPNAHGQLSILQTVSKDTSSSDLFRLFLYKFEKFSVTLFSFTKYEVCLSIQCI